MEECLSKQSRRLDEKPNTRKGQVLGRGKVRTFEVREFTIFKLDSSNFGSLHPFFNMGSRISAVKRSDHNDNRQGVYKPLNIVREEHDRARDLARPEKLDILLDRPSPPEENQVEHAWNPNDRSVNVFVKDEDPFTFHRHPVAQSTDCIRGKKGYNRGFHVWELTWSTRQRGTHAVVGVSTEKAPLHCTGYQSLVGNNEDSWGWDIVRNKLYHNEKNVSSIKYPVLPDGEHFAVPDHFRVVLDMDEGTLAFESIDGRYLGVAFRGLKGKTVYPTVSAVWGHCEITMRYIGGLDRKYFCIYFYKSELFDSVSPLFTRSHSKGIVF